MSETHTQIGDGLPSETWDIVSISDAMLYLEDEIQQHIDQETRDEYTEEEKEKVSKRIYNWFLDNIQNVDGIELQPDGTVKIDYEERRMLGYADKAEINVDVSDRIKEADN